MKPDPENNITNITLSPNSHERNVQKIPKKWVLFGGLALLGLTLALLITGPISQRLEHLISFIENRYQEWFSKQDTANP